MDFSILDKADLSDAEVADILAVSDIMVYKYRRKGATPRQVYGGADLYRRVDVTLKVIERLVEKGQLPRPQPKTTRDPELRARRAAAIDKIKQHVTTQLAAAPATL